MSEVASGLNKGVARSDELLLDFRELAHKARNKLHQLSLCGCEIWNRAAGFVQCEESVHGSCCVVELCNLSVC